MDKNRVPCPKDGAENQSETGETMTSTDYELPFRRECASLPGEEVLPCIENDYSRAKAYLMKQCLSSGDNLWDHLNEVLQKILVERPRDIGCTFEEFSYRVKEARFKSKTDHLLDVFVPPKHYELAQKLIELLQPTDEGNLVDKSEADEEEGRNEPDTLETFYYFNKGGIGLPEEEIFCLSVHMKKLTAMHGVERYRFWGKILGTRKNYYVAETELNEDELAKLNAEREVEEERIKLEQQEQESSENDDRKLKREAELEEAKERELHFAAERSEAKYQEMVKEAKARGLTEMPEKTDLAPWPPIPLPPTAIVKKTLECPVEPTGTGVNKKVYFVCQGPGDEWIRLPDVTPQQITAARKIKRAFTGDLDSDVITFPSFPGKERNLLRAQIARISAGTQISPLGYYTFNEEEEEEEAEPETEERGKTNYMVNPDFEPVAIRDLVDPSMSFWVHHTHYILEQGRTTWWNPTAKEENNEDEGEVEEEEGEKEIGPELLTPLSEDSALDAVVPWSVRKTSSLFQEHAVAIVRSNLWPGAYAFATNKGSSSGKSNTRISLRVYKKLGTWILIVPELHSFKSKSCRLPITDLNHKQKFDNVYIGYGHKFSASNHSPVPMQEIQEEYPLGPEIMEIADPTPEQEEEWRLAHEVKEEELEEEEEEVADDDEDED